MKKIIVIILSLLCIGSMSTVSKREALNNYLAHSEIIDVNELNNLAKRYDANQDSNIEYFDFLTPESELSGSMDYVDYTDNSYSKLTSFTKNNYFENLYEYSAFNSVGSCGYVSLIQVMSYYDTFYNDAIIPDLYDRNLLTATSESDVKLHSPGVNRQNYYSSGYSSYYQYCHSTQDFDLQSKLTIVQNVLLDKDNDDTHLENGMEVSNFKYSVGGWSYQNILNSFYSEFSGSVLVNEFSNKTQSEFVNLIKDTILTGNPIIVHIKKYNSDGDEIGFHSVVAYDYDETDIFANFGWGYDDTHTPLLGGKNGYSVITNAYTLDFSSMGHSHSNNYIINDKYYCGCNISDDIHFNVPINWKNIPPTLYWMKDLNDDAETYSISFKASRYGSDIVSYKTIHNQMTLSLNDWNDILKTCNGNIYIKFKRISSSNENYYNSITFVYNEPNMLMDRIVLAPSEYGFEQRYYFEGEGIKSLSIQQGNYNIGTTRLRCGFIEGEYIVLAPRRTDAGLAYLIYNFECKVYRIDVDLTLWSSSEGLNKKYDTALLQYLSNDGDWKNQLDLLNDITLSKDRTNPGHYIIVFPEGVSSFKFVVNSFAIGSRNKGRICIGDMNIYLGGTN